jgi:hypothetical protein
MYCLQAEKFWRNLIMKRAFLFLTLLTILAAGCGSMASPTLGPATPTPTVTSAPSATPLPTSTPIPSPVPDTLYVNPSQSLGMISPWIYGSNYGPAQIVPFVMLQQAYDSGITILRFPAGAWGDHNNVTPRQINDFMDFAKKVGATTMFNVRLLGGTPQQAAEMVRYTNIEKGYNVRYWGIGNEPTLYNAEVKNSGETYDITRFNKEWREFALAMKAVDPTIQLVGAEINQFSFSYQPGVTTNFSQWDETWFVEFLKNNGDLVDIVSFHRYPFPRSNVSGPPSVEELMQNTREWDQIIIRARELIHEHTGRDLPIAVTEFNSAYDNSLGRETTPDSHLNAIWMADVLGRMIKNGVFMANQWRLVGTGGLGLIGPYEVRPSYYTYQMYRKFGSELVYSSSDDPNVSIYAAKREDGALTIMLTNLSLEEVTKALRVEGQVPAESEAECGCSIPPIRRKTWE